MQSQDGDHKGDARSIGCNTRTISRRSRQIRRRRDAECRTRVGAIASGVVVHDQRGVIVDANPAACTMLGLSRDQLIGRTSFEPTWRTIHEDGSPFPGSEHPAMVTLRTRQHVENVVMGICVESMSPRWLLVSSVPICDDRTGRIREVVASFVDITGRKRAEDEQARLLGRLEQAQERYRALFESVPDAILVADSHARYIDANRAATELLGYTRDEILQLSIADVAAAGRDWTEEEFTHFMQQGSWHQEHELRRKDGSLVPVDTSATPVQLPGGTGYVAVIRDISARRRLEQERERLRADLDAERNWLRAVIERSPVGIILVEGSGGKSVWANRRAEQLFGRALPPGGGIAQYVGQVYHPNGTPLRRDELVVEQALHGKTVDEQEELLHQPGGREVHVLASGVPIAVHGRILGAVVVYEDITGIRELERLREEWLSVIAHDLRQPLSAVTVYGGLLQRRMPQGIGERERPAIEHILTAAWNLNKMIGDLLDVSRIEARRLTLQQETVNLPDLVKAVVERTTALTQGRTVRVEASGEIPPLCVDPSRIEQVLGNLLSNAAKYGYPGTEILVTLQRKGSTVTVSVTNQGQGIGQEEIPDIFSRFFRTHEARGGQVGGLGLGLYITKGIVEAHHGQLSVESIPGKTTTFRFSLPIQP